MTEPLDDRRTKFIKRLYALGDTLERDNGGAPHARQLLAQLRRSLTHGYQPAAWNLVHEYDPPEPEEQTWVLVAGLFASHPSPLTPLSARLKLGAALQATGDHGATERRLQQLISVGPGSIDHYVRQAVRLIRAHQVPIDYQRLLNDLIVLRVEPLNSPRSHQIRMQWARDFHRARANAARQNNDELSEGATA
ncbi:type I-E CRISPR-associated protein Cse2/CasB [Saccharomonospora sp. NB11]|jgi:CRISPR system Cascade subunit CasB|uniref:type I-E CRISPR-associated protein Cse2/CasB n=1 Tax=Saccharomonospora sp. NB11 TaxID=1642298 RepID=UPI0018D1062B|nr:type I-E CRISPR-associated protein Cse2/CasB [Saccharomonospora sp. NB11]